MANKRMFNRDIVESDAFTSMSPQAQALYLHLCMNADDDGFLNNAKRLTLSYDLTPKVLQELLDKRFLLDLGDGITVIKHWFINNALRKDRYNPTAYTEKRDLLTIKENGSYTDDKTKWQPNGNQMATSLQPVRATDKISIDKYSKGKNINRKRLPDFHKEEGEETDIKAVREKMFGKEIAS